MEFTRRQLWVAVGVAALGGLLVVLSFVDAAVDLPVVHAGFLTFGAAVGILGLLAIVVGRPTYRQRLDALEDEDDESP